MINKYHIVDNIDVIFVQSITLSLPIIYVTENRSSKSGKKRVFIKEEIDDLEGLTIEEIYTRFAPIFPASNSILIPKKAEYNLRKYVSKKQLKEINKDIDAAVEMCLMFLDNLSSTYYNTKDTWKTLSSTYLHNQFKWKSDNTFVYKKIITTLTTGTKKTGPIIQVYKNNKGKESYKIGETSKKYSLTSTYLKPGLIEYKIKSNALIKNKEKYFSEATYKATKNPICLNLLNLYPKISLPTNEQLIAQAKKLVKENYKTPKGKLLTFRNKHKNPHWKNYEERSFVEVNIKLFEDLTKRGFMLPQAGSIKSGGRVVDSFTLMPSWIRKMCKINGEPIVLADYSCLHPNIAMKVYGGSGKHISHDKVATYLNIQRQEAKLEHLEFFNKHIAGMKKSPLFKYYEDNEPGMLKTICSDKKRYGYKITSRRLFKVEVQIIKEAIIELNKMNILVGYVYDALFCEEKYKDIVVNVMNEVVKKFNINTHV